METAPPAGPRQHRDRRADPAQARLRAGALPRHGRVPELRDLVHDHLDPRGLPDVVLRGLRARRPRRGDLGLAARRPASRRSSPSRWPRSPRPSRPRAASTTGPRSSASPGWGWTTGWFNLIGQIAVTAAIGYGLATFGDGAVRLLVQLLGAHERLVRLLCQHVDLRAVRDLPDRSRDHQHVPGQRHGAAEHDLGVLAHGGRRVHRARADHRPGQPPERSATSSARRSTPPGYGNATDNFSSPAFWFVFGLGLLLSQYTITGFDASAHMAEETRQASRQAAVGMYMSVVVSVVFGWILLLAVTFAIPSTRGRAREHRHRRAVDLGGVDEPELGGGAALHLRRRAVLLRHGVGHLGVADDVRVLARPGRARAPALEQGRPRTASRATPSGRSSSWRAS